MSCLCRNTSAYYSRCNCGYNHSCGCQCLSTTTTTLAPIPCIDGEPCEVALDPNCIIYCGPDLPCYGIQSGDTAADILQIIIDLLICTTTTTSTSTSTTSTTSTSTSSTTTTTTYNGPPTTTSTSTTSTSSTTTTTTYNGPPTTTSTSTTSTSSTTTTTTYNGPPTTTSTSTTSTTSTSTTSTSSTTTTTTYNGPPTTTSTSTTTTSSTTTTTTYNGPPTTTSTSTTSTSTTSTSSTTTTTTSSTSSTTTTSSTSTTTSSTSTSTSTTTTTTTLSCDCYSLTNQGEESLYTYVDCNTGNIEGPFPLFGTETITVCARQIEIITGSVDAVNTAPCSNTIGSWECPTEPECNTQVAEAGECLSLNGGFDYNLDNWNILGASVTWSSVMGGSCALEATNPFTEVSIFQNILQPGSIYRIQFDVLKIESQTCDHTLIYLDVFAGTTGNGPILQNVISGTVHVDITMTCTANNEFKITGYNPVCDGGPFLYIDNVCVTQINTTANCDVNLFIVDQTCNPCLDETCLIKVNPTPSIVSVNYQVAKVGSPTYSINGTKFRTSGSNPNNQLNGENSVIQSINTGIWTNGALNSTDGPLNRCAIQIVNPPSPGSNVWGLGSWYGYRFPVTCIDPTLSGKKVCIGIGGGEFVLEFFYEGAGNYSAMYRYFITDTPPGWVTPADKTQSWNVYEIQLPVGAIHAYIGVFGNEQPWGFEVYDQPMSTLVNATTVNDLNIIYSSLDIDTLQIQANYNLTQIQSGQPTCPSGFYYEPCSDKCVAILSCPNSEECPIPCTPGPLPNPRFPTTYYGNIQMTYTYTGPTLVNYIPTVSCTDIIDVPGSIFLGYNAGAFSYTVIFSEPVNDIELQASASGAYNNPLQYEEFTFNTNAGEPTLISCENGCLSYVQDNKYYGTSDNYSTVGALWFKVSAPSPFTQMTITGLGGLAGTIFGICSKDVGTLYEQYPLIFNVKSIYTSYDIVGAPPTPPSPEPEVYSVYTNYDI